MRVCGEMKGTKCQSRDLGLLIFFFIYTIAFTWVFDKVFGLPLSAR